jgi:hypothetical protein
MPRLTIYVSSDEKEMFDNVANKKGKKPSSLAYEWHINKLKREHTKVFNQVIKTMGTPENE